MENGGLNIVSNIPKNKLKAILFFSKYTYKYQRIDRLSPSASVSLRATPTLNPTCGSRDSDRNGTEAVLA